MRLQSRFAIIAVASLLLAPARPVQAQVYELIDSFAGCPAEGCGSGGDAATPLAQLVLGPDGNFYGTSPMEWRSGEPAPRTWGTVFRVSPNGTRTVLHDFRGTGPGGCGPGNVTFGTDGLLYGVGTRCGPTGSDTIFRLNGISFEVLQAFPAGGLRPSTIVASPNGRFYGAGVQGSLPVIYKWNGASAVALRTADAFTTFSSLIAAPDGNLYFTEQSHINLPFDVVRGGAVLRLTQDDRFQTVHTFLSDPRITAPEHDLILGPDGALYGNESRWSEGVIHYRVYRLTLTGVFTYLTDSSVAPPIGAGPDGSVYFGIGTETAGIIRRMPDGTIVPVHDFDGTDGGGWVSVLTRGRDGDFYGTTSESGEHGLGVFFRIRLPKADLKANGSDGPIGVGDGNPLQISMAFDASATEIVNPSEVYLAVVTPALQIIWIAPSGFSLTPSPLYSGPLPSFPSTPLINVPDAAVLPPGDYYWVTIVDADANGVPNGHYVDFVKTTKTAAPLAIRR